MGEGLSQPFTTLHCPSPYWSPAFVGCRNWLSYDSLLLLLALNFDQKNGLEEWNRWREVKGGEGLEQPFTPTTYWITTTYVVKVKGEGLVEIFSWIYKIWYRTVAVLSQLKSATIIIKWCKLSKSCRKVWQFHFYFLLLSRHLQVAQLVWASEPIEFGSAFVSIYGKASSYAMFLMLWNLENFCFSQYLATVDAHVVFIHDSMHRKRTIHMVCIYVL